MPLGKVRNSLLGRFEALNLFKFSLRGRPPPFCWFGNILMVSQTWYGLFFAWGVVCAVVTILGLRG